MSLLAAGCVFDNAPPPPPTPETSPLRATPQEYADTIQEILSRDRELGQRRNEAPLHEPIADAIRAYVNGIDQIDFSTCPDDFAAAFEMHRNAWESSIAFFEPFYDLRGELHDVFDMIRTRSRDTRLALEEQERKIRDTWSEVETAALIHGAYPPDEVE